MGTHPDFQGRGLVRYVMREGLRRLQARGATTAMVSTAGFNRRAIRLYDAIGMRRVLTFRSLIF